MSEQAGYDRALGKVVIFSSIIFACCALWRIADALDRAYPKPVAAEVQK